MGISSSSRSMDSRARGMGILATTPPLEHIVFSPTESDGEAKSEV